MSSNFIYITFHFISAVLFLTLHFLELRSMETYLTYGEREGFYIAPLHQ